jgi:hypothetical protein
MPRDVGLPPAPNVVFVADTVDGRFMDADYLVFGSHDTTAKVAAFIRSGRVPDDGFFMTVWATSWYAGAAHGRPSR